jgi:NADH-quinone oxidoreductase subunit M
MALQGAVVQMLAHGLSAGALFILCGELYERLHTRDLRKMGGLWSRITLLPGMMLFFAVAALGLPGTGNFIGEFLILLGVYKTAPLVAAVGAGGLVLAVVYSLRMVQVAFFGPSQDRHDKGFMEGLNARELALIGSLAVLLLGLGLYPQPVLDLAFAPITFVHHTVVPVTDLTTHAAVPAPVP